MPLFAILTLFPEAIEPYLGASILGSARQRGLIETLAVDVRDFTRDRHRTVDDRPFGGGPGMVLRPEPIADCIEWLEARHGRFRRIAMSPAGPVFRQQDAESLSVAPRTLLLAGRYEGFDERLLELFEFERFSLGDFVLSGGELPALCIVEAAARLIPGVLGDEESARQDSFSRASLATDAPAAGDPTRSAGAPPLEARLLDTPHYTRPRIWRGKEVPDVLLSGNHAHIDRWRAQSALRQTRAFRPDLLAPAEFTAIGSTAIGSTTAGPAAPKSDAPIP